MKNSKVETKIDIQPEIQPEIQPDLKPEIQPEIQVKPKIEPPAPNNRFTCRVPSMWSIIAGDKESTIVATCTRSRETFKGTVADFNKRMAS